MALDGEPYIHDPSTVLQCDGKYYTFGTGGGGLISDDGWTWHSGARVHGGGAAPDLIHIGDRYYMAYATSGGGLGGGHASTIHVMWSKTLDPNSPDYGFNDDNIVASSDGVEDCDAIDPGVPARSHRWPAVAHLRDLLRLHPASSSSIPRRAIASPATSP